MKMKKKDHSNRSSSGHAAFNTSQCSTASQSSTTMLLSQNVAFYLCGCVCVCGLTVVWKPQKNSPFEFAVIFLHSIQIVDAYTDQ